MRSNWPVSSLRTEGTFYRKQIMPLHEHHLIYKKPHNFEIQKTYLYKEAHDFQKILQRHPWTDHRRHMDLHVKYVKLPEIDMNVR